MQSTIVFLSIGVRLLQVVDKHNNALGVCSITTTSAAQDMGHEDEYL